MTKYGISYLVTPYTGVWIETYGTISVSNMTYCHTLHGCVD